MPPNSPFEILLEDNHLLAVNKPAGMATMGVAAGQASVLAAARQYIKHRYAKPGNVYLGVVSRLDEPVSGVLLFARTSKAAARLSEQFRSRSVEKTYWAIVDGENFPLAGTWEDFLLKDEPRRAHAPRRPERSGRSCRIARISPACKSSDRLASGNRAAHRPEAPNPRAIRRTRLAHLGRSQIRLAAAISGRNRRSTRGGWHSTIRFPNGGLSWSRRCPAVGKSTACRQRTP